MAVTSVSASLILRGFGGRNTAAAVTAALGIEPTRSWEFGDPHPSKTLAARGRVTDGSHWRYEEPRTIAESEDPHGMESLVRLAERFEPVAAQLAELSTSYDIVVDMFAASDSGQGGFYIGPETMRRLGMLSAAFVPSVYLDEYYSAEEIESWDLPRNPGR